MAETYLTIDRKVINLLNLQPPEEEFFERVLKLYRQQADWAVVDQLVHSAQNPLLAATGGVMTREVYGGRLYEALRDLVDGLGLLHGRLGRSPGFLMDEDPVGDSWVPVALAAKAKGLSVTALHKAIRRGELVARPITSGGSRLEVSVRSLDVFTPSAARQRAGGQARLRSG